MTNGDRYDPAVIEAKWQRVWEEKGAFQAEDFSKRQKAYLLFEFPFLSGDGLHVGHCRPYSAMDALARKRRMEGQNVLFPIGWDAFGLPTENYALKTGVHPRVATDKNIATFRRQIKALGMSLDWSREVDTSDPQYYRWTQWLFLQFFNKGLAYQATMPINWCPKDKIGLANEEVVSGKCERCGTEVTKKLQKQWMLKITAYAERLLKDLDSVDYPERIKTQQVNWIGKSEGAEIEFRIPNSELRNGEGRRALGIGRRRFVLLHGFNGTADGVFFPWLKKELEAAGHEVIAPNLPNPSNPTEAEQVHFVLNNVPFDEHTVLFGHSLGAVVALKVVEKLKKPIAGLVLAGGFTKAKFKDKPRPFQNAFSWDFDYEKIRKKAGFITVLSSTNDYAVPIEEGRTLARELKAPLVETQTEGGHFTGKQEPVILDALVPSIRVFTTRPDTLFGATYLVLAPDHPLIGNSKFQITNYKEVKKYIDRAVKKSDLDRTDLAKVKTGVELKGLKAVNPANNEKIPIWVADYVLLSYGTGAIMAVPAHDERDNQFAKNFNLPIREVVRPGEGHRGQGTGDRVESAWVGDGTMVNSSEYDGIGNIEAGKKIVTDLEKHGLAKSAIQYKLRDWVFSRQHYWGEPIPIIHCQEHGAVPVPEDQLPVELPHVEKYQPTKTGESPLAAITEWVNTTCPVCQKPAKRETDTMPNWAGSSWYFLRYTDPKNNRAFADPKKLDYWLKPQGVDLYEGGMEHTTLHLLYSRFWHKFLFDQGLAPTPEPYAKRRSHGIVLAEDGRKMSKSFGNVINPDAVIEQYGADTLRIYEMFMGPFEDAIPWSTRGLIGMRRFLDRVWKVSMSIISRQDLHDVSGTSRRIHVTIKKVSDDLENFKFNTAVSALMEYFNARDFGGKITASGELDGNEIDRTAFQQFLTLLLPLAPHLASELLERLGVDPLAANWPVFDPALVVDEVVTMAAQVNGTLRVAFELPLVLANDKEGTMKVALRQPNVQKYLKGKEPTVYFIPRRLINFVVDE